MGYWSWEETGLAAADRWCWRSKVSGSTLHWWKGTDDDNGQKWNLQYEFTKWNWKNWSLWLLYFCKKFLDRCFSFYYKYHNITGDWPTFNFERFFQQSHNNTAVLDRKVLELTTRLRQRKTTGDRGKPVLTHINHRSGLLHYIHYTGVSNVWFLKKKHFGHLECSRLRLVKVG